MQGFNYNLPKDWTAKMQNVKDQNTKHQKWRRFPTTIHLLPD